MSRLILFVLTLALLFLVEIHERAVIAPASALSVADYRLVAIGTDTNPREVSKRLGLNVWSSPVQISGIAKNDPRVYPVKKGLWFATNDDDGLDGWGFGVGRRTRDGGQTWDTPGDPGLSGGGVVHYASDAGGRVWALWHDSSETYTRTKLSYSDDDGTTWSAPVITLGTGAGQWMRGWKVLTHPTNANVIAIIGFSALAFPAPGQNDGFIARSLDRGSTWTVSHHPKLRDGQAGRHPYDAVMLATNRIIALGPFGPAASPQKWSTVYTDDFGLAVTESWSTTQSTVAAINGLFVNGSRVGFLRTNTSVNPWQHRLMLSTDNGANFAQTALSQELESFLSNTNNDIRRFAMSSDADAMYFGLTNGSKKVVRLSPVGASGLWVDLTGNYPHASQGRDNLGVVPNDQVDSTMVWGGAGPSGCRWCGFYRGSVNLVTGNFFQENVDVQVATKGPALTFARSYNSQDVAIPGRLGYGWRDNFDVKLLFNDADHANADVAVVRESGRRDYFLLQSDGTHLSPFGNFDTLTRSGTTFELKSRGGTVWAFDNNGTMLSLRDKDADTLTFAYTGGKLTSASDAAGRSLTFSYLNPTYPTRITKITDPISRTVEFTYDASGDLTQVKDVKGYFTSYVYVSHRITSITDPNSHVALQNLYDGNGRVAEQLDGTSARTCIYFGWGPSYTGPNCPPISPIPGSGQTVVVDPRTNKTTYTFDSRWRTTKILDALNNDVEIAYGTYGDISCVTDQRDKKWRYVYDIRGNIRNFSDPRNTSGTCALAPGGKQSTWDYTSDDDLWRETDPLGQKTEYTYDSSRNPTRIVRKNIAGSIVALTCTEWNSNGLPTAVVQSTNLTVPPGPPTDQCTGNRTLSGYDANGYNNCIVNPRFSSTSLACDQIATKATMVYDNAGRLQSRSSEIRQPQGPAESGSQCAAAGTGNGLDDDADTYVDDGCPSEKGVYDPLNMVTSATNGAGNVTTVDYFPKGNLKSFTDGNRQPAGAAESGTQCGSLGAGNAIDEDSDGKVDDGCPSRIYQYSDADTLTKVIEAAYVSSQPNSVTTYTYDGNYNLTSVTDAKRQPSGPAESGTSQCGAMLTGNGADDDSDGKIDDGCPSSRSTYNAVNSLESAIDALGRQTSLTYWENALPKERTDGRGWTTKFFPDDAKRLDFVQHWRAGVQIDTIDYSYDDLNRRTGMTDPTGVTNYLYDALHRPTSVTSPGPKTVAYQYDSPAVGGGPPAMYPGQRTKITYPDATKTVAYTYEADGRMKTVKDWLNRQTTYTYGNSGRLDRADYPNGFWSTYNYEGADRLTGVVNTNASSVGASFSYTLDAVGNRIQEVNDFATTNYQYDALQRLTSGSTTYTYDANGNRLSHGATAYTYDAANQMLTAGGVSYGYDGNGNQTSRGSDSFTYDDENRLTGSVIGGIPSSSIYNGDGLRMTHTVSGQTTGYDWDVGSALPEILNDNTRTYVYGLDLTSATDSAGNQNYYMHNGVGSVSMIADYGGGLKAEYYYSEFGLPSYSYENGVSNDRRFSGEQRDADSGLYYLRARYYDPATGRFLSQDPVAGGADQPQSQNAYPYVMNNPVTLADPSGMSADFGWDFLGIPEPPGFHCLQLEGQAMRECIGPHTLQLVDYFNTVLAPALADYLLPHGYWDLNVTLGCILAVTGGVQTEKGQGEHPYLGGGLSPGYCGVTGSLTFAPLQSIARGAFCGVQYNFLFGKPFGVGPSVQVGFAGLSGGGNDLFREYGVAAGGGTSTGLVPYSPTCAYVW